jgi:hypothetical protein
MKYLGIVSGLADGGDPRLQVATASGQVREIPLDKTQLLRIIRSAVGALEVMEQQERRQERHDRTV